MADESLGHIDLRLISSAITGGAGGAGGGIPAGTSGGKAEQVALQPLKALEAAFQKFGTLKDVFTSITQGGGVRGTLSEASGAVSAIGSAGASGIAAGALVGAVAAIGIGVVAVSSAAMIIKSGVSSILGRVSELARVNAGMAQQEALNQIADIRRDMAEARVLGPLYAKVSEIMRSLKDAIQPFLILFKGLFTAIIIPILNGLVSMLNGLAKYIPWILQFIIAAFQQLSFMANIISVFLADLATYFTDIATPLNGLATGFSLLGFGVTTIIGQLGQVLNNLNQQQGAQSPNQWAINTLNALSSGGALTPALVPAGPTMPGYNPKRPRVNP